MQVWVYNTDSFCYGLVCLLCVTLSARGEEYDNKEGRIPLTHTKLEPPSTEMWKVYHFIIFAITIYILFQATIHTAAKIWPPLAPSPLGLPLTSREFKSARSLQRMKVRNPVFTASSLLLDFLEEAPISSCWPGPSSSFLKQDLSSPLSHGYCPFLTVLLCFFTTLGTVCASFRGHTST